MEKSKYLKVPYNQKIFLIKKWISFKNIHFPKTYAVKEFNVYLLIGVHEVYNKKCKTEVIVI